MSNIVALDSSGHHHTQFNSIASGVTTIIGTCITWNPGLRLLVRNTVCIKDYEHHPKLTPKWPPIDPIALQNEASNWPPIDPVAIQMRSWSDLEVIQNWPRNDAEVTQKWPRIDPIALQNEASNWPPIDPVAIQMRPWSDQEVIQNWTRNDPEVTQKCPRIDHI